MSDPCSESEALAPSRAYPQGMGDLLRDVDVDSPVVSDAQQEWLVKHTPESWNVWIYADQRRPRRLADIRARVAAITASVVVGVLGLGGLISYAVQWQTHVDKVSASMVLNDQQSRDFLLGDGSERPADLQEFVDGAVKRNPGPGGAIGVAQGQATSWTPEANDAASDVGFVKKAVQVAKESYGGTLTYWSPSTECVYSVMSVEWDERREMGAVVRVVDLAPYRHQLNQGFLLYSLAGLGVAGASAGAVYLGLGRRRNNKVEPDEA